MTGLKSLLRFTSCIAVLLIAGSIPSARAQGGAISGQVLSSTGKPVPYAPIRVCPASAFGTPCSPLSLIYSDAGLTQFLPNPTAADNVGNYDFFAYCASYLVQVTISSTSTYSYNTTPAGCGSGNVYYAAVGEVPSGSVNGTNRSFVLSATPAANTLLIQLNGQVLTNGIGYIQSGTVVTFTSAPQVGDNVFANYFTNTTTSLYSLAKGEIPSGAVNGVNTAYTLTATPVSGTLLVQLNGQVLEPGVGYTASGSAITITRGAPQAGDAVYANYLVTASSGTMTPVSEVPTGAINGTNAVFTLSSTPILGTLVLQLNGQVLENGIGYTLVGGTVTLAYAPLTGGFLFANYSK